MKIFLIFLITPQFDSLLFQGIHYSYQEEYTRAEEKFRKAIELEPMHPAPYLLLTSLYGLYLSDFSADTMEKKFFAYSDTTVRLAKQRISAGDTSGLTHLWLAGGYGARAFYKMWRKNIISGIQDGIRSIREFSKAVEIDSTIYDAYIGIAGYNYFKHRFLSFVPWMKNEKWEREIKLAIERGKYFKVVASTGYALLLIEEKRYMESAAIITKLVEKFPNSKTFRWIRARSYCGMGEWELAKNEYTKLLELTLWRQPDNFYNIGYCKLELARVYLHLREKERSKFYCNEVINLPDSKKINKLKKEAKEILKIIGKT
jgi:tetratricopeptide (TPR) repeat protein